MAELNGGLIQMNAHLLTTAAARGWIITGVLLAALGALLALCVLLDHRKTHRLRYIAIFAAVAVIGVAGAIHGASLPRVKGE